MSVTENTGAQMLATGSWQVDPVHSVVEFRVRHMMIATIKGRFRDFDGTILGGEVPSVRGSIRVASLETLDATRDEHLRSPEFFDVDRFPGMTFEASGIEFNGDGRRFLLSGELTIKDVTRPVLLDGVFRGAAVDPDGSERIAFTLRGELDRTDFGLVWNRALETGGMLFGNGVELALDVAAVRAEK
jgi:polyisoprenoid-binding protein YceI